VTLPAAGEVLAQRFVIEGPPLGEGLTGAVLPAHDEVAERPVAVKLVHDHLVEHRPALARLQAEAGAASHLRHPHLLVVFGLWSHEGRWFLVTERLDGRSLESPGTAPLTTEAVIVVGMQVADALEALHREGHAHGDVRPGHVMLSNRGAVLLGFGQVGVRGASGSRPGQTAPEVALGTPAGVPADLYGLGVALHHGLTGRLPFRGPTPWAVIGAQQRATPELPPGPKGLARLIADLMHPLPDRRPPSVRVVRQVLEQLREDPDRRVRWERTWLAPVDLTRGWVVHGADPETGGPAVVRAGLGRRQALTLAARLRDQGWDVRSDREALGLADLLWMTALGLLLGVLVPVLGLPFGIWLGARWRSRAVRPRLRTSLPAVRTPVPPRMEPAGREHAAAAGILLLAAALLLAWSPAWALVPGALFAVLVALAWRERRRDQATEVFHGRLESAFQEIEHALEHHGHALDDQLSLQGELDALEMDWRAGKVSGDHALQRVEGLRLRAFAAPPVGDPGSSQIRDALKRTRAELSEDDIESS
jgi:hypothetical protein